MTVTSVILNPTIVYSGTYTTATIKLSGALPAGSGAFYLSSINSSIASVSTSIGGATGDTQETFIVDVAPLTTGSIQTPSITVTYGGVPTSATLTVLVDTTTTFFLTPIADAFGPAGTSHAANFGGLTTLVVKTDSTPPAAGTRVTYLKFDLTGVTSSPARALLKLYFSSAPNVADRAFAVNVYSLPGNPAWLETGITWDIAPNLNKTNTTNIDGTLLDITSVLLQPGMTAIDVTGFVQSHLGQVGTIQIIASSIWKAWEYSLPIQRDRA